MTTDPTPARYRHRSPEVEAVQWTGSNADQLRAFCGPDFDEIELDDRTEDPDQTAAVREADHGTWRGLAPGDWVVRLDGGLYEFSAADFAKQYEPADRSGLRERIAVVATPFLANFSDQEAAKVNARELAAAVLSVLPPAADRAAILREAADELGRMDYDTDNNDYGYDTYRDAWNGGVMDGADLLRRLAAGERDEQQTQQGECAASISGNCLRESQSETACDTEAGECVHGGRPAADPVAGQPPADTGEEAREEIECANCWRVVENRSTPNMGGPSRDNWVHVPGGFQPCFPQRGADSPRAEPELTVVPQPETVHGCPPDGSGLTPCCGRTPFELPLTDRISSEAPVTCTDKEA